MEMQIEQQLLTLEKLFNTLSETVTFHLTVQWGALAFVVAASGTALYVLAKQWVNKRVDSELEKIKQDLNHEIARETKHVYDEVFDLKNDFDQRVIHLIENNLRIRWASGSISSMSNDEIYIHGLNGKIDWDSQITNVRVRDLKNKRDVPIELISKDESSFSFKLLNDTPRDYLDWVIVWSEKASNN